jgi:epoxyqueuosine reductase QueG
MQKRAVEVVIGLQKHAADAGVVEEKLVAEAAGVGVTYGDNHN